MEGIEYFVIWLSPMPPPLVAIDGGKQLGERVKEQSLRMDTPVRLRAGTR